MALFKKTVKKQNLDQVQVYIEDSDNKYFRILDSPDIIPTGRSSILIDGSTALKRETDILFELIDASGKAIYVNPIRNYLEGTSRRLSIEVYEDVVPGLATLTLLGEIRPTPEDNGGLVIPEEFQDVYNVRYQTEIMVDPSSPNNEKILFLRSPKLSISETILQEVIPKTGQKEVNVLVSGSLSGERIPPNVQQFLNPNLIANSDLELRFTNNTKPTGVIRNNKFKVDLIADAVGPINNVEFDWGDSTTDSYNPQTANGSHTFTKAGTYIVRANGNSPFGGGAKDNVEVTITPPATPNADMFISNGTLNEAQAGETQYLTGSLETSTNPLFTKARFRFTDRSIYSASADNATNPDDNIDDTTFQWDFGDGRSLVVTGSAGKRVIHEYSESGDYTVTHTVGNNYNTQTNSTAQTVKVQPTPAVADFSQSTSVVNTGANFNVTSSATVGTGVSLDKFHWYFENAQITGSQFINYAPNNIFGSALSGFWDGYSVGNTSVTRQSSVAYSGSNAIAQVSNAEDSYFGHYRGSSTSALAPATQSDGFTVSGYARSNSGDAFAYLALYGLDENYETIGNEGDVHQNIVVGDSIKVNSSGWTKVSVHSRFLHPGTKHASFRVGAKNSSGKTIYWDGFQLFPTSVTGSAVSASYDTAGNFDIEHYVVDDVSRKSNTVIKQSVSNAVTPRPHVTSNVTTGTAPVTVTFTEDGEGTPTSQTLFTGVSEIEMSASGQTTTATYSTQGIFNPRIVANWSGGTKEFKGQPITVNTAVPRITSISGSTAVTASQEFTLIVSASSTTESEKYIDEMSIAWGDSTSDLIYFQAGVPTGLEFNGVDASHISLTHAYAASGAYTASAVVKDTNGKSSTSSSLFVDVVSGQVPVVADTDIMIDDLETVNEATASLSFGLHNLTTRINRSYYSTNNVHLTSYTWSLHDTNYDEIYVIGNGNSTQFIADDVDFKAIGLTVGAPGVSSNTAYYNIECIDTEAESLKANANSSEEDAYDDQQYSEAQSNNGGTGGGGGGGSSYTDGNYDNTDAGRNDSYMTAASPEVQNYKITLDSISDSREVGDYLKGAKIKVDRFELYEFAQRHNYPVSKLISQNLPYELTVSNIKGNDVIPSSRPLTFNNSVDSLAFKLLEIPDLGSSPYTMSFNETVEFDYNEINYISKSTFKLSNLRTLSGDVYRAKVYYRTTNDTEFIPLTERILESREELIDDLSLKGNLMKGFFPTRSIVDTYWTGSQGTNAGYYSGAVVGSGPVGGFDRATIKHIHDAVVISGSNYSENDNVAFWLNTTRTKNIAGKGNIVGENRPLIIRDIEYSLSFNAHPIKATKQVRIDENLVDQDRAELKVYVSGSGVKPKKIGEEFESTPWGYYIGSINPDDKGVDANITFPKMVYQNFILESTARPIIQFIATSGKWYISSVSLKQARESGFNPNNAIITTDTPLLSQRPQRLLFKVEYFTKDGKQAQMETFSGNAEQFQGSNTVFSGTDNILPGTLTINNSLGEGQGFELSGQASAYFRTKSYEGFKRATTGEGPSGILMFSGSVGTAISASEDYDGLGLELHAGGDEGSLKFRTNPSVFEVKAKSFFLGSTEQYVSGSGGNIEISSSNFHLSSSGDVVVKGNIEAQTGKIGGFNIGREKLSGETFYIRGNADENSTSDSGLFISASNFQVRADGHISGTAGNIAGWGIEQNSLGSSNIILSSTGSIRTRDYVKKASGWTIDSDGFAEFSNVFVRGTLATTTFEKQTVNAVGGQLLVSNATTISGSVTDSATTLPLVNSAGFQPGELLFVKKVGDSGFSSEFMRLTAAYSASDQTGNSTGFINAITVTRELQGSVTGSIGNFGGAASVSASYDDGQVIISFGRPQTGFIHINADPTDTETPYIDVIESGSGGFLRRARFGDLSGLASTAAVHNESSPGFGLAAENVFLSGSIRANEGYIGSWNILNNGLISGSNITLDADSSRIYKTGDNSETEGYYLDFTPGTNYYVRFGTDFAVSSSGQLIASGAKIEGVLTSSLGLIGGWTIAADSLTGGAAELNSDGNLTLGSSNNVVRLSANDGTYRIWAGNATAGSAPFRVTKAGALTATGATISGDITITDGDLSGVTAASISGSSAEFSASLSAASQSMQKQVILSSDGMSLKNAASNKTLATYGATTKIFDGENNNSYVEVGGGSIDIVSGSVTQSRFDSSGIIVGPSDNSKSALRVDTTGQLTIGTANTTNFTVTTAGAITMAGGLNATHVKATSGSLGGFDLESNVISGSNIHISSSNGGAIKMGTTASIMTMTNKTVTGSAGIFLSGSGDFSFQRGTSYMRGTSDGLEVNFPSFSIDNSGLIEAEGALIKGRVEAGSGFFGESAAQGWNIEGNKITDSNGKIEIDGTAASPNITITSGSFVAELVPEFTKGSVILQSGGNNFSDTDSKGSPAGNEADSGTISISDGNQSAALTLYAGFSGATTSTMNATLGSITEATLSANGNYKSKATIKVDVTVNTGGYSNTAYQTLGNMSITGNLVLRDADDVVVQSTSIAGTLTPSGAVASTTIYTFSRAVTVNHTVGGADKTHYWGLEAVRVQNNNLNEWWLISEDPWKSGGNATDIIKVEIYYTTTSHEVSNKKTELAPSGFQSVALEAASVSSPLNRYVRAAPEEDKTFDVLGKSHFTGSIKIGDNDDAGSGYIMLPQTGDPSDGGTLRFVNDSNFFYFNTGSASGTQVQGLNLRLSGTNRFGFATGTGGFHSDNDITAFSTTVGSDIRLKENIERLENNLDIILKLKPSSFTWKIHEKKQDIGLIAQEVEEVIPVLVKEKDTIGETAEFLNGDKFKTVDYAKITTILIGAIQEQQEQIDKLKKKFEDL